MSASHGDLIRQIREFIVFSFVRGEQPEALDPDLNLIEAGILDSLAIIEVADYLESLSGAPVQGHEINPETMGTISAMARFVAARRKAGGVA
ncbi:MAG TPA: D-alanine--poly(phosphoribitol) ligase subunit 2 [Thermoanaerobaculia bacterium]|nr:D-alanine--poly(phosphoribitol) ligase subunit 2 [Thermoanaerobaculia bacterium]